MSHPIRVLSIDGGGIRGLIPAVVLAEIEKRTGKPTAQLFDLITGTSTGGILALGLVKPGPDGAPHYSAAGMISLYEAEGGAIFARHGWRLLRAVGSITDEKYSSAGIDRVLDRYFGEARLKDALTDVVVTSYEIERRFPFFFKSAAAKAKEGYDFAMKHVARATSAAPTYFEPLKLVTGGSAAYYALVDGGVFANNPAMCGFVEAKTAHPEASDFIVVSLGTGEAASPLPYDKVKSWGLAQWAQPIFNVVLGGVSDTVDYQLRHLLPPAGGLRRYYRFQPRLEKANDGLDDTRPANLRALKLYAEALVRERSEDLDMLCGQLTA